MGEVYLATHLALKRPVAIKTLRPDYADDDGMQRFLKEARSGAQIDHANLVTIHDVGRHGDSLFIVMQFVPGKDIADLLKEVGGPLPWKNAVRIIRLAAKGLNAIHRKGLVHRDVKPSNIMLSQDGEVLVTDFGLAREVRSEASQLTGTGVVVGTVPFMSPEQCSGKNVDGRSDIFSLGSTLYNLVTNQLPYQGTSQEVFLRIGTGQLPDPLHVAAPHLPRQLSDIVAKAMAPKPEDRFQTAAEFSKALSALLRATANDGPDDSDGNMPTAPLQRHFSPQTTPSWVDDSDDSQPIMAESAEKPAADTDRSSAMETEGDLPSFEPFPAGERQTVPKDPLARPAIIAAAVAVICLIPLAIGLTIWNLIPASPTPPPKPPEHPGMVHIEEGYTRIGNKEKRLRDYLTDHFQKKDSLEGLIEHVADVPEERVLVTEFFIDKYEVTNAQYSTFLHSTGEQHKPEHWANLDPPLGREQHPVVNVTYKDAEAYADWAGKKLPTREQWLRAFRGDSDQLFCWGDEYHQTWANVGDNDEFPSTSPVDQTPRDKSAMGVFNLVGNVSEFLRGYTVKEGDSVRQTKGAEFKSAGYVYGVGSVTYYPKLDSKDDGLGFRCVIEVDSTTTD